MSSGVNTSELIAKIQQLAGLSDDERSRLIGLLRSHKKYGLVWEDKPEDVEERLRDELPILREVKERFVDGEERSDSADEETHNIDCARNLSATTPNHILIEGDNLEALTALTYTHEGKIDVIYIDPPYNTGNKDFVYNDSFVDSEDSYRHSKWLSFMNKRLKIAKRLLSDKGVIFISIDDNEQAQLKLLCDEVFGSEHFVGCLAWQRTYSTRNDSKGIPKEVESIMVYSKATLWTPKKLPRTEKMDALYKSPDNDPKPWTSSSVSAPGGSSHQGMVYAIQHPFTGEMMYPTVGRHWSLGQNYMLKHLNQWCDYQLCQLNDAKERAKVCGIKESEVRKDVLGIILKDTLEISREKATSVMKMGNWPYFYFTNGGKGGLRRKTYLENMEGRIVTNFFPYDECGHTDEAKKELMNILDGKSPFDTPKPTRLLKRICQISSSKSSLILDFFAGSGTTLHATMQLNAEDGGHRQCILVTNNENGICENVTYERNKRVIEGYTTPKGQQVEGLRHNRLRYYKTDFISRERTQRNMRQLVWAATDMLCIKEDLYAEQPMFGQRKVNPRLMRYFSDGQNHMLVVYREDIVDELVEEIAHIDFGGRRLKIYIFSPGRYAFDDDFYEVHDKVQLVALPAAIYDAYQKVLPRRREKPLTT